MAEPIVPASAPYEHFTVRCLTCGCSATVGGKTWRSSYHVEPTEPFDSFVRRLRCSNCKARANVELIKPRLERTDLLKVLAKYTKGQLTYEELEKNIAWLCKEGNSWAWEWWEGGERDKLLARLHPTKPISKSRLHGYSSQLGTRTKQWLDWETGTAAKRMWE